MSITESLVGSTHLETHAAKAGWARAGHVNLARDFRRVQIEFADGASNTFHASVRCRGPKWKPCQRNIGSDS